MTFKIGHINIRSLIPSLHDLEQIIHTAEYDSFCISETWLGSRVDNNAIRIDGYNLYRQDRRSRGGGLCIYLKDTFLCSKINGIDESIEQLWIEAVITNEKLAIGAVYRPPSQDASYFLSVFEDTLGAVGVISDAILCPDVSSVHSSNLNCIIETFNLLQVIDAPTRVTANTATLIDLIMICNTSSVLDSGVHNTELSDHQLIYCLLKKQGISTEPKTIIIRDFKNFDVVRFQYDLGIYWKDDGLNIAMIKLCFPHILPSVRHIINFCISNSVYPSNWKKAVVMALPKKPILSSVLWYKVNESLDTFISAYENRNLPNNRIWETVRGRK
nr:unnamed protein product [Callosobruchus analis]